MSEHYEQHAEEVCNTFFELVGPETSGMISAEHRNELAMLIEAAISTAVFEELEQVADKVASLSQDIRDDAEKYDRA